MTQGQRGLLIRSHDAKSRCKVTITLLGAAPIELVSLVAQVTPQEHANERNSHWSITAPTSRSHSRQRWMAIRKPTRRATRRHPRWPPQTKDSNFPNSHLNSGGLPVAPLSFSPPAQVRCRGIRGYLGQIFLQIHTFHSSD